MLVELLSEALVAEPPTDDVDMPLAIVFGFTTVVVVGMGGSETLSSSSSFDDAEAAVARVDSCLSSKVEAGSAAGLCDESGSGWVWSIFNFVSLCCVGRSLLLFWFLLLVGLLPESSVAQGVRSLLSAFLLVLTRTTSSLV